MTNPAPHRNAPVDCLRGIAILSVLLLHFALAYRLDNCPLRALLSAAQLEALFYNGNYGVTVFFVISGYLITSMSLRRWGSLAQIDARTFYLYRVSRLMPCLILALTLIVTFGSMNLPYFRNSIDGQALPASYFFIATASVLTFWHNVLMQSAGWFNYCLNVYWSLSVEEVFYLALPLACLTLRRTALLVAVCAALMAYAPVYRSHHVDNEIFFECSNFACFDAIAMGVLTALATRRWTVAGRAASALRTGAALAACAIYLRGIDGHETFGFSMIALCTAAFLVGAAENPRTGIAASRMLRPLRWLGRHSYELYLFHIVVLAGMRNVLDRDELPAHAWAPWLALFLVCSALCAQLIARFISEPANRAMRDRFDRPRGGLPGASPMPAD